MKEAIEEMLSEMEYQLPLALAMLCAELIIGSIWIEFAWRALR